MNDETRAFLKEILGSTGSDLAVIREDLIRLNQKVEHLLGAYESGHRGSLGDRITELEVQSRSDRESARDRMNAIESQIEKSKSMRLQIWIAICSSTIAFIGALVAAFAK